MIKIYKTKLSMSTDHNYFSEKNLRLYPERFVIVGFIAADGCIFKYKTGQLTLVFNIAVGDREILDMINKEICNGVRNISYLKNTKSVMLQFPSDCICEDLKRFNIVERKSKIYQMPVGLSDKEMSYFLRGYFYGDGCIQYSKKGKVSNGCFLAGSESFSKSFKEYVEKNKIVDHCANYKVKGRACWQMRMTGRNADMFSRFIFADDKLKLLPRKHIILKSVIKNSKWTNEEKILLLKLGTNKFDKFCEITGRSKKMVISYHSMLKHGKKLKMMTGTSI